ncbi:MAG: YitT family protein [Bacteroidales bacterium]|nr:YitT family protein [Bacteroidales bacterium]
MKNPISKERIHDVVGTSLQALRTWKFWKEWVIMTLGMLVAAVAVYYFLVPSKLIIGSISGLSIVVSGILAKFGLAVKVSTVVLGINAILLVLAYFLVGKEFGIKTVYTALILGPLMDVCEKIYPYSRFLTDAGQTSVMGDVWFDLLCFVLLLSASQAILFRINASTGGLDILAKIVNKYLHFDIGASVSVAGAIICCTAFAINPFRMVVIGLIGTWINGLVVDYFTAALNKRKRVCIVSKESEKIRRFIIDDLVRGCSLYEVTGGFSGEKMTEVQVLLTQDEFSALMAFLHEHDIKAFITAGNVSEVYGLWFQHHGPHNKVQG